LAFSAASTLVMFADEELRSLSRMDAQVKRPARVAREGAYLPELDGLRAFAVGLVLLSHLSHSLLPNGLIGVDIFFVLSGFLITGILLREREATNRIRFGAFYMRRLLRLTPALTLVVAVTLAVGMVLGEPGPYKLVSAAASLLYVMDFVRAFSGYSEVSALGHTWSLSVEEHFYLVWPLLIAPLVAVPARLRALACVAVIALIVSWRAWCAAQGASHDRIYYAFEMRADQLLAGCALAAWCASNGSRLLATATPVWAWAALSGLVATALAEAGESWPSRAFAPVLTSMLSCMLILSLTGRPASLVSKLFSIAPIVAIGRVSYGIYLWHWPLLLEARYLLPDSRMAALLATLASIPIAFASYNFLEKPFLRLKRRFE
jgi:peptidoglycan/LPS O-acetylase OafA/YrhL